MATVETQKFQQLICKSVEITKHAKKSARLEKSETKDHYGMNPLRWANSSNKVFNGQIVLFAEK